MLRKTVLTFAFLTALTTFYGFNATFDGSTLNREPAAEPSDGGWSFSASANASFHPMTRSSAT